MFFLSVQFQLVSIERNMELENHHLSASVITGSGKNHQWILKLVSQSMGSNSIFIESRVNLTKRYILVTKGKW